MRRLRRRSPFADVVARQLSIFAGENPGLLADVEAALHAYDAASADEAEERYGDFVDLADAAREELEAIRDRYARTLEGQAADEYRAAFADGVRKRFPRLALEPD